MISEELWQWSIKLTLSRQVARSVEKTRYLVIASSYFLWTHYDVPTRRANSQFASGLGTFTPILVSYLVFHAPPTIFHYVLDTVVLSSGISIRVKNDDEDERSLVRESSRVTLTFPSDETLENHTVGSLLIVFVLRVPKKPLSVVET